ncbi:hypothetical protein Q7P37_006154 [Cladosporium fusiforme]
MDPLTLTLSITALIKLTKDVVLWAKEVKDAPDERETFIRELSSLYGMLSTLDEFIKGCDPAESWLEAISDLTAKDGPLVQLWLSLQRLNGKVLPGSTLRKMGQKLVWKHVKEDINGVLSQMERLKSLIGIALEMDHMKLSRAISDQLGEVRSGIASLNIGMSAVQKDTAAVRDDASAREKAKLLDKICSMDYLQQHRGFIGRHHHGTGEWFLNEQKYQDWSRASHGTLFCPGVPGAGKTMMAALVIERLLRDAQSAQSPVVFMYYNYKRQSEQTLLHTLEAFLRQVVSGLPCIPQSVDDLYRHTPSTEEVKSTLATTLGNLNGVTIVTDALDECHERTRYDVLDMIDQLQAQHAVKFLATSRDFHATTTNGIFQNQPWLEIKASKSDLESYTRERAKSLRAKVQPDLKEELVQGIVTAADGMFLLAQLLMDSFQVRLKVKRIKEDLQKLPQGVDAYDMAYSDAMERIFGQEEESRDSAKSILSLVLCATRPLHVKALQHALMIEPGDTELDKDNILEIEDVTAICAGLITIDEESGTVRFVHYTTQEYLQRNQHNWLPQAHCEMAHKCLSYLLLRDLRPRPEDDTTWYRSRARKYWFARYAARQGPAHIDKLLAAHALPPDCDIAGLPVLLQNSSAILIAWRLELADTPVKMTHQAFLSLSEEHSDITGMRFVSEHGYVNLLKACILQGLDVHQKDTAGSTPLIYAASNGNSSIVDLLLDTDGIDANAADNDGQTALIQAVKGGHLRATEVLLSGRVNVNLNLQDWKGRTALSYAATHADTSVLGLLLSHGQVELDLKDGQGRTPLSFAASTKKSYNIIALLRSGTVDPDSRDKDDRTPLSHAAGSGSPQAITCLLQTGKVEADSRDTKGRSPLSYACSNNSSEVASLLLQLSSVDSDSRDNEGRSPFSHAAEFGCTQAMHLLSQTNNIDVNSQSSSGRTPLSYAVAAGNPSVAKMLLGEKNILADQEDSDGRTPLLFAAENCDTYTVRALIESGKVNINARDKLGRTPLSCAAESKAVYPFNAEMMHRCVEELCNASGILIDARDQLGRTPLFYATKRTAFYSLSGAASEISAAARAARILLEVGKAEPLDTKVSEEANRLGIEEGKTQLW